MRITIVGAGGRLGAALAREYASTNDVVGFSHAQLDLADPDAIHRTIGELDYDVLINCAAQTNVDRCETHPDEAFALNAEAPRMLAEISSRKRARLVHISTDYVFDGEKREPYTEDDLAEPLSVYGRSKLEGEQRVVGAGNHHLVARVSWVFGPDRASFIDAILNKAKTDEVAAIDDKFSTPTYTRDLAEMLYPLLEKREVAGVLHVVNQGGCSWREYAQWALDCCHAEKISMKARVVETLSLADMQTFVARRPVNTILSAARYEKLVGEEPRHWRESVAEYVRDYVAGRLR